jgi:hypothetical protein
MSNVSSAGSRLEARAAGKVFVVWNQASAYGQPARSFFSASSDSGATWSTPLMLGVPVGSIADDVYAPALAVAPGGRIDVAFTDQARDLTTGFANFDLTYSNTGGAGFSNPIVLDSVHSGTQQGGYSPSVGVASSDMAAYTAWTDTRRGDTTNGHEDIFFAAAIFSAPAIAVSSLASGASYTQGQAVSAAYTCSAAGGDVLTACAGTVASGAAIDTHTLGQHTFTQARAGRKLHGRCVAGTRKNRDKSRCARTVVAGTLKLAAHQGADTVSFAGRISRARKLRPGRYTLVITAINVQGQRSAPRSLRFTIVR